ncbi:MAG TPA: galactose oxidase-like domain-containing protein [Thermoanaerobaculia bacterium]|nr:galactose oxidase-like domain-containing protein [Thermoanaerobaculia bacterium]
MNLLPPRIKGPLSECSTRIRVESQFPGADVEVVDVGTATVVATGTASSATQDFTVTATLVPGHRVAARQTLGTDASGLSAESVELQSRPEPVGPVAFATPLFQCGRCLWLEGLVPGARVEIRDASGPLGSGEAPFGIARVHLGGSISSGSAPVTARQEACGVGGPDTDAPAILPLPAEPGARQRLPAPTLESPLLECSHKVGVGDVFPGATVELKRSSGPDLQACFDLPALRFGVNPPLVLAETVQARQRFPQCEVDGEWSPPEVVELLEPVPPPTVKEPLCAGGTTITLCGLKAGARVRITIAPHHHHGGIPLGGDVYEAIAPDDGCFDFALATPGLPGGGAVYATQELCSKESEPSNVVHVHETPEKLPTPDIPGPLFECATVVHVESLHPGTRVYVVSAALGEIGDQQVYADEADVTVAPLLQAGDQITAYAIGCGLRSDSSVPEPVRDLERLQPPRVAEPLYSCSDAVEVVDVVPGAWVDIFVDGVWAGRAKAGSDEVEVPVQVGELEVGDTVTARQTLCGRQSELSQGVTVVLFDGRWVRIGGDDKSEILAVHVGLLPTGQIVIFAGDQYTNDSQPIDNTRLMDSEPPYDVRSITGLPSSANLFCSGHCQLADGTILVASGTKSRPNPEGGHGKHWFGLRDCVRFEGEPEGSEAWVPQGPLSTARPGDVRSGWSTEDTGGRWYPTLITLPDGRALALGGHPLEGDQRHTNTSLELFAPATGTWSLVGSSDYPNIPGAGEVPDRDNHSEYPRMHVLPEGTVFVASNMQDGDVHKWTPDTDPSAWTRVDGPPPGYSGNPQPYTTVLLPLSHLDEHRARILICGRTTAYTIEPEGDSPAAMGSWTATGGRSLNDYPSTSVDNPARIYPLATLLPTGEVLVSGGTTNGRDANALKKPEIYTPSTNSWRTVHAEADRVRNYHSTALLVPSGAVWHSGSNFDCEPGTSSQDRTVELFEPWYFCEHRPALVGATQRVCQGDELRVETPDAHRIEKVVLVRCGTFTHAFNPDQRLVDVSFRRSRERYNLLIASLPLNPAILIVGWYLLFVLDHHGVPSRGRFVQVCHGGGSSGSGSGSGSGLTIDREWLIELLELLRWLRIAPEEWRWLQRALERQEEWSARFGPIEGRLEELEKLLRTAEQRWREIEARVRKLEKG